MPPITPFLTNSGSWGIICVMQLTVVGKLDLSPEDKQRLEQTLDVFAAACNAISQVAFAERCFHPVALHHRIYYDIRQRFNLLANLTIRARERVAKAYKTAKAKKQPLKLLTFKPQSLDLDAGLFRLFLKDDAVWVSLAACDGKRVKCPVKIGQRYLPILRDSNPTSAVLKRHRGDSCCPSGLGRYWAAVNQPQAERVQSSLSKTHHYQSPLHNYTTPRRFVNSRAGYRANRLNFGQIRPRPLDKWVLDVV